jgi:hypothetical protein
MTLRAHTGFSYENPHHVNFRTKIQGARHG